MKSISVWRGLMLAGCGAAALAGCATKPKPTVVAPSSCGVQKFDVYFAEGEATLTPAARTAISLTATALQTCNIRSVKVMGLADATGAAASNQALSERRAQAVTEALEAAGWPAPAFEIGGAGSTGAETGGVAEPLRRRTEVVVDAVPK